MKFKVGDICKITRKTGCFAVNINTPYAKIREVDPDGYYYYDTLDKNFNYVDSCSGCLDDGSMEVYKGDKVLPVQFIVIYDLVDRDPAKTFTSRKELNKWLKEAKEDRDVIFSSIKVFEVKREYEVKTSFSLKKK